MCHPHRYHHDTVWTIWWVFYDVHANQQRIVLQETACKLFVSPGKSRGHNAFVIVTSPPPPPQQQRFLVCTLCPKFSSNLFQLHVICLLYQGVEASQFWCSAIPFVVTRGPNVFSSMHSWDQNFQMIFIIFTPNTCWTKIRHQSIFSAQWFHLWPLGPNSFVSSVHCKPLSFQLIKFTHTFFWPRPKFQSSFCALQFIFGH